MMNKDSNTNVNSLLLACDGPSVVQAHLTVKEVARLLGKSDSTVYRIDRENGPFRFISTGRRVLIDAESFQARYPITASIKSGDASERFESVQQSYPQTDCVDASCIASEIQAASSNHMTPPVSLYPSESGGQRELVMPLHSRAGFLFYMARVG